ncbi:MAG: hypothetical protein ACI8TX_001826 [Hyphomicrobiaceae bacterium]|jgi:hypothetical protein
MALTQDAAQSAPRIGLAARLAVLASIFVVSFAIYGRSLGNGYSIDDYFITQCHHQTSRGLEAIPEILTTNYMYQGSNGAAYRPVPRIAFAVQHELFGDDPRPGHIANVILHCLAAFVVFGLVAALFPSSGVMLPAITALLFAVHPIHTEVVASLKNRDELMASLFGIACLRAFLQWNRRGTLLWLGAGTLLFALSLLSKGTGHQFLGLIPLVMFFDERRVSPRFFARVFAALSAAIAASAAFWFYVLNFLDQPTAIFVAQSVEEGAFTFAEHPLLYIEGWSTALGTALYSLGYYARLMVFPHPLSFFYGYGAIPIVGVANPVAIVSAVLYLGMAGYAFAQSGRRTIPAFAILFYLGGLAIFANLLIAMHGIIAERHVYTAATGFCLLAAWLATDAIKNRGAAMRSAGTIALVIFVAALGAKAFDRSADWQSHRSLAENDVQSFPDAAIIHAMLAKLDLDEASRLNDSETRSAMYQRGLGHLETMADIAPVYRARVDFSKALLAIHVDHEPETALEFLAQALAHATPRSDDQPADATRYIEPTRIHLLRSRAFSELGVMDKMLQALGEAVIAWNESGKEPVAPDLIKTHSPAAIRTLLTGKLGPDDRAIDNRACP